jgi:hypothetical protein
MDTLTKDKRIYKRYNYQAPIVYEYGNTNSYYEAMMCNHSMGGMCFESNYALPKGVEINIRMKNFSPHSNGPESRESYRAQVRWCMELREDDSRSYKIGVNYFEPVLLS